MPDWTLNNGIEYPSATITADAGKRLKTNFVVLSDRALTSVVAGRLTLDSGDPVPSADQTGTTLYYTPYRGNEIGLYDDATGVDTWKVYPFSEISIDNTGLIADVNYDVFLYDDGGTLTLELVAWKKVTASNSPSSGSSVTINLSDTGTLFVGAVVTVKDGSNQETANVTAVVANTSITVDSLTNSYTTPDVFFPTDRETTVTVADGAYIKSGSQTHRYLGTVRTIDSSGVKFTDTVTQRFVWNANNPRSRILTVHDTSGNIWWTYSSTTYRPANNRTQNRVELVVGMPDAFLSLDLDVTCYRTTSPYGKNLVGIGEDKTDGIDDTTRAPNNVFDWLNTSQSRMRKYPSQGYHYYQWVEADSAGQTSQFYGTNSGAGLELCGITGFVEA